MTLYATDLDGTLLRPDMTISDESARLINEMVAAGTLFTYATARSYSSASPLLEKLHLTCPAVTFNGVFVIDPRDGRHIVENVFAPRSVEIAVDYFNRMDLAPLVYSYIDGRERVSYLESRLDDVYGYVSTRKTDKRLRPVKSREQLFQGRIFYFTLLDPAIDRAELDSVFSRENGFAVNMMPDTYNKDEIWYEIFNKNASKASAILQVMELTRADRLVCFGDNTNDLSMIRAADVGVAVSNACGELKEAADKVIGSCSDGAVARFAAEDSGYSAAQKSPDSVPDSRAERFSLALNTAMSRDRGLHGSVGTQNEQLIHAALKNYYVPDPDSQEIRIGKYFADAVSDEGIFEIQTRKLYALCDKLSDFTKAARVNVVHPVEISTRTVYVDGSTGEVIEESQFRAVNQRLRLYEELYSMREHLANDRVTVILAKLKTEKRVICPAGKMPDMRSRRSRKKCTIVKVPLELKDEVVIPLPEGLKAWIPDGLPERFTKKDFCAAAKEPYSSLRLEVIRAAGLIEKVDTQGRYYVYSLCNKGNSGKESK